jgi:oligopeptidase B
MSTSSDSVAPSSRISTSAGAAPSPKRIPHSIQIGDHKLDDDYFWMRDDARKNEEIIKHLELENKYAEAVMKPTEPLQKKIYDEFLYYLKEDDASVPYKWGPDFYYARRTIKGQDYAVYTRGTELKDNEIIDPQTVLDVNAAAKGFDFFSIGCFSMSPDHTRLAYSVDTTGFETYEIRIIDVATGELVETALKDTSGSCTWINNDFIFYTTMDAAHRPHKLHRHRIGTAQDTDACLYTENDERFWLRCFKSLSGEYVFLSLKSKVTAEIHFIKASEPEADFTLIEARVQDVKYSVDHQGDYFWIVTDADDAKNFKLMHAPVDKPGKENWQTVIAHNPNRRIEYIECFKNCVVVFGRQNGLTHVGILDVSKPMDDSKDAGCAFPMTVPDWPEEVFTVYQGCNRVYDIEYLRLSYSSPITPDTVYDYQYSSGELVARKRKEVPHYEQKLYECRQLTAKSHDDIDIPVSYFYKKETKLDQDNNVLMFGYGAYSSSFDPDFNARFIPLLNRGIVIVFAHIRGGGEMGRLWYENGKYLNKKNTFFDFISCAEHLVNTKFTSTDKLVVTGSSAGGLLMGAVLNMRPDLFKAAYTRVPFVDIMATMSDPTIPLTVVEWEEWGNPCEDKYFDYMLSYSPYNNVADRKYPAILATSGLNDSRVAYWEPAKWVTKLRHHNKADTPIIFRCQMSQGHGGSSGRYKHLEEIAFLYAFVCFQLEIDE